MRDDFVVFILSHGRANIMKTVSTLEKCGYTSKWYIIIDNEDVTANQYYDKFGKENVLMFDKLAKSKEFDTGDRSNNRKAIVYARNVCFDFAKQLGYKYFLELDDDYTEFRSRVWKNNKLSSIYVKDLDSIIDCTLEFLEDSGALTVAFAQTGDFIGGRDSKVFKDRLSRKAMNSFFCKTENKFDFVGRINEDVNTYVSLGSRGEKIFTIADMTLNQLDTQQHAGGMSDCYIDAGTYVKSFFTVMMNPSSVKIYEMGCSHKRIHHAIDWEVAVPKIVSSRFKK